MRTRTIYIWIFLISLVSTLGSLYFQYFWDPVVNLQAWNLFHWNWGFVPCLLCRWARIFMYPLVWISFFAIAKKRDYSELIILPSFLGILLEFYQNYLAEKVEGYSVFCDPTTSCTTKWVDYFGFMTIPFLCLVAFVMIFVLGLMLKNNFKTWRH